MLPDFVTFLGNEVEAPLSAKKNQCIAFDEDLIESSLRNIQKVPESHFYRIMVISNVAIITCLKV